MSLEISGADQSQSEREDEIARGAGRTLAETCGKASRSVLASRWCDRSDSENSGIATELGRRVRDALASSGIHRTVIAVSELVDRAETAAWARACELVEDADTTREEEIERDIEARAELYGITRGQATDELTARPLATGVIRDR